MYIIGMTIWTLTADVEPAYVEAFGILSTRIELVYLWNFINRPETENGLAYGAKLEKAKLRMLFKPLHYAPLSYLFPSKSGTYSVLRAVSVEQVIKHITFYFAWKCFLWAFYSRVVVVLLHCGSL